MSAGSIPPWLITAADAARNVLASPPGRPQRSAVFGAWDAWNYATTSNFLRAVHDAPVGEPQDRWLAMIAAMVEHIALQRNVEPPSWVAEARFTLRTAWVPAGDDPWAFVEALVGAPASFAVRNVWLDARDLASV
jgi:hypothetical protein